MEQLREIFSCDQFVHLLRVFNVCNVILIATDEQYYRRQSKVRKRYRGMNERTNDFVFINRYSKTKLLFQLPEIINQSATPAPLQSRHQTQYIGTTNKTSPPTFTQIEVTTVMIVSAIAISIYAILSSVREVIQIYQQKLNYLLDPSHCVSWLLYVSSLVMVMPVFCKGSVTDANFSAASITVFLSWFNLLLFLQRFDQVGLCC